MAAVRLGKNHLRWCDECNLPIRESKRCPVCGGETPETELTPPGDSRPAFEHDISLIKRLADSQFGEGSGDALIPEGRLVILNKAPSLDRMEEIVVDGTAMASIRYDIGRGWRFINRMQSALRIGRVATRGYVTIEPEAVPFVRDSKNLMAPGVLDAHPGVRDGDEVIIMTSDREVVATGIARMSAGEMISADRGLAVKTKWYRQETPVAAGPSHTWEDAVKANEEVVLRRRDEAVAFINRTIEGHEEPAIVSFSGGKDSLATLLLTLDAGRRLPVLFVDTGLEFGETVRHLRATCERHGLTLIEEKAPTDAFFGNLVHFGPPAKDFRWCCKTNKLGPTVAAINKNFPDGVLSFIGQRKYESEARNAKPRIWSNPWTPGQIGASAIQSWSAMHVWLYIFHKKEPFNVWYTRGLDRIGCFLCPASDMSELEAVSGNSDRYGQWDTFLDSFMRERGLPPEWKEYGLWRWKRVPQSVRDEVSRMTGKDVSEIARQSFEGDGGPLRISVQEGYSPCVIGYSVEAAVSRPIDLERLRPFARALAINNEVDPSGDFMTADFVTVYREGSVISKANIERDARANMDRMWQLIVRSEQCVGCGLCAARCGMDALYMKDGRVEMEEDLCIRCKDCFGPCPALNFGSSDQDGL
jgi:phosphoadenosine phosphosulfate reductase